MKRVLAFQLQESIPRSCSDVVCSEAPEVHQPPPILASGFIWAVGGGAGVVPGNPLSLADTDIHGPRGFLLDCIGFFMGHCLGPRCAVRWAAGTQWRLTSTRRCA